MNDDILNRLNDLANKWDWAQPEVARICRDAMYEINLLREVKKVRNEHGSQRLVEGAD